MQRRRLLLAIAEVAGGNGLEAATVGRICEQAGVSRRTFYELFADREACLLAALNQTIELIARKITPSYAREGGWHERIHDALESLLEHLDSEPDLARLCVVEAPRAGPEVLERRRQVLGVLIAAVDEGRGEVGDGGDPPPLTAQGVIGGVLSVIHGRLLDPIPAGGPHALVELTGPLMAMIVHPYLGPEAARRELERPAPAAPRRRPRKGGDPFKGLPIRFTYRTARVLATIATDPGASNRHIADQAGIVDEGQTSRLLRRLRENGLIENSGRGHAKGEPNAWALTGRGKAIHAAITVQGTTAA